MNNKSSFAMWNGIFAKADIWKESTKWIIYKEPCKQIHFNYLLIMWIFYGIKQNPHSFTQVIL